MVTVDDYIGKRDNTAKTSITKTVVSGTRIPAPTGLMSYDYISITNTGSALINLFTTNSGTFGDGYTVASGSTFSDVTGATLYIQTSGNPTTVEVYTSKRPISYK